MSDFDLIEKYLLGNLSAEEMKEFRFRLLNDPSFNQEFQELKEIRLQVKQKTRKELKSFFDEIDTSIENEKTTKDQTVMKKVISIAASLVLIAAISYIGLSDSNQPPSNQELFNAHYETYGSLVGQVRSGAESNLSLEDQAFSAYNLGDYETSSELFAEAVESDATALSYFYLGISQLEMGNTEESIKSFNTVLNNFSAFKDQSRWYLALSHLKNNDEDAYLNALASIVVKNSEYEERAQEVLKELGLTLDEEDIDFGEVSGNVERRPKDDDFNNDSPDGSLENTYGLRKHQWGMLTSMDGSQYRFHTDEPIDNLDRGDGVVFVVIQRNQRRGRNNGRFSSVDGRAYVIDKY